MSEAQATMLDSPRAERSYLVAWRISAIYLLAMTFADHDHPKGSSLPVALRILLEVSTSVKTGAKGYFIDLFPKECLRSR